MTDNSAEYYVNSFELPHVGMTGNVKLPPKDPADAGPEEEAAGIAFAEEPVAEEAATAEPVVEEPVAEDAATDEPVVEEPVAEDDAAEEPATESPATEETATEEAAVEEDAVEEVAVEEAAVEEVATEEEQTTVMPDAPEGVQATEVVPIPLDAGLEAEGDVPLFADQPEEAPAQDVPVEKPKGKIKPWMIAAAVAAALGLGFAGYQAKLSGDYNKAVELYEQGDYAGAADAFGSLGNYKDAATQYDLASKWADAESKKAAASTDPAKWTEAAKAYELIGDDEAAKQAQFCKDASTYYTASRRIADKPEDRKALEEAIGLFQSANGVFDSDEMVLDCQDSLAILDVKDLMGQKKWADALAKLDSLSDSTFNNASTLRLECEAWTEYEAAEALFNSGKYYDAYVKFNSIVNPGYDGFPNLEERAKACIQSFPSGVVYRNDSYSSDDCQLSIDNSGYDNCYYKLYQGDTLVMSICIPENGKETFMLPSGTYHMNKGYGETWFGTEDMFGDEGRYWKCSFGGSETFTLDYGWAYEISTSGEGTGISTSSTDRGSM
ncbi:MAG: hypothetical protein IJ781_01045 [Atopobiaceae bacterium]|nr:hypothetical protein [Atopobiaceae bacterium]